MEKCVCERNGEEWGHFGEDGFEHPSLILFFPELEFGILFSWLREAAWDGGEKVRTRVQEEDEEETRL